MPVCNQPATQGQLKPSIPPGLVNEYCFDCKGKGRYGSFC